MKIFLVLVGFAAYLFCDLLKPKQVVPFQPQTQDAHDGTCGYC